MPFSALGIHLLFHTDTLLNFLGQFFSYNSYTKLKCFTSVSSILNHSQIVLYFNDLWLPGPRKKFDIQKLKIFKRWVPLNFLRAKKLLRMVCHDLCGVRKRKIVFLGNWNPWAWMNLHVLVSTRLTMNSGVCNTFEHPKLHSTLYDPI